MFNDDSSGLADRPDPDSKDHAEGPDGHFPGKQGLGFDPLHPAQLESWFQNAFRATSDNQHKANAELVDFLKECVRKINGLRGVGLPPRLYNSLIGEPTAEERVDSWNQLTCAILQDPELKKMKIEPNIEQPQNLVSLIKAFKDVINGYVKKLLNETKLSDIIIKHLYKEFDVTSVLEIYLPWIWIWRPEEVQEAITHLAIMFYKMPITEQAKGKGSLRDNVSSISLYSDTSVPKQGIVPSVNTGHLGNNQSTQTLSLTKFNLDKISAAASTASKAGGSVSSGTESLPGTREGKEQYSPAHKAGSESNLSNSLFGSDGDHFLEHQA